MPPEVKLLTNRLHYYVKWIRYPSEDEPSCTEPNEYTIVSTITRLPGPDPSWFRSIPMKKWLQFLPNCLPGLPSLRWCVVRVSLFILWFKNHFRQCKKKTHVDKGFVTKSLNQNQKKVQEGNQDTQWCPGPKWTSPSRIWRSHVNQTGAFKELYLLPLWSPRSYCRFIYFIYYWLWRKNQVSGHFKTWHLEQRGH